MNDLRLLRVKDVAVALGMSVQNVWLLARTKQDFPKPIKYSARITVWRSDIVQAYIEQATGPAAVNH